jgi:hypothetical protein
VARTGSRRSSARRRHHRLDRSLGRGTRCPHQHQDQRTGDHSRHTRGHRGRVEPRREGGSTFDGVRDRFAALAREIREKTGDVDLRILSAREVNARPSFRRTGTVLGVPDQTVDRRFRRLCAEGGLRVVAVRDPEVSWGGPFRALTDDQLAALRPAPMPDPGPARIDQEDAPGRRP